MSTHRTSGGSTVVFDYVKGFANRRAQLIAASLVAVTVVVLSPATAQAQDDPNPGALTLTAGVDALPGTPYVFRGIVQESDPKITLWPYADLGISLYSGEGVVKAVTANLGMWNSLQNGSSGAAGPSRRAHYEQDFYGSLGLSFGRGVNVASTYTAYRSPNGMFGKVEEVSVKLSHSSRLAPYGVVAKELSGQADAGSTPGTYMELGVGPSFGLGRGITLAFPLKVGISLENYYEGPSGDQRLGFVDAGTVLTVPLSFLPATLGAWNIHGGAEMLYYPGGDSLLRHLNAGSSQRVVGLIGFGVSY